MFSLYDRWSNKLLSAVGFHSIQLARLFEGHWAECGIEFFFVKINIYIFLIQLIGIIIGQLIDYQNNR